MPGNDPLKGHDSQIAIGVETTQGTTVVPDQHFAKIDEEVTHTDPTVNWYEDRLIGGDRELSGKQPGQRVYDGGSYPVKMIDAVPLALLFGGENFTAADTTAGTPPTHTFTARMDGMPPTATVEATQYGRGGGADFVRTFEGVAATSGELSTDNDSRLSCSLTTVSLGVTTGATPTDVGAVPDVDPWLFSDISSNFSFAGTAFARLENFTLNVDNQMTAKHYVETGSAPDPFEILYGNVAYDLSATITVDDDTLYQELVGATGGGVAVNIEFTRGNGDTLTIDATGVNVEEAGYPTPRGDDESIQVEASLLPESVTVTMEDSNSGGAIL